MALPTASDINVHDSLDERHACEMFLGKSVEEAEALFRENALFYYEDLMWMGPVAFRFYVMSFIRYLQSDAAAKDLDAADCFASLLEFRLAQIPAELSSIASQLASTCRYIIEHDEKFDLDPRVSSESPARFRALELALTSQLA